MEKRRIGVFWDFENFAKSAARGSKLIDLEAVVGFARQRGNVVVNRAYGDWSGFRRYATEFNRLGIELIQLFEVASGKNAADIKLATDVIREIGPPAPSFDELILVTSDADFTPLVTGCLRAGIETTAIGVEASASAAWMASVERFVTYRSLTSSSRTAPRPKGGAAKEAASSSKASASSSVAARPKRAETSPLSKKVLTLLDRALDDLADGADVHGWIYPGSVKLRMRELDADFTEKNHGARTFSDFLRLADELVEVRSAADGSGVRRRSAARSDARSGGGQQATPTPSQRPGGAYGELLAESIPPLPPPGAVAELFRLATDGIPVTALASTADLDALLAPVAADAGVKAGMLRDFLVRSHVLRRTDPPMYDPMVTAPLAVAACFVDAAVGRLIQLLPGVVDCAQVLEAFGGEAAPDPIRTVIEGLSVGNVAAFGGNDPIAARLTLRGVPGSIEHRARAFVVETSISRIDIDALVEVVAALMDHPTPWPEWEEFGSFLASTLLSDWALEPGEALRIRGALRRSGIVAVVDGGTIWGHETDRTEVGSWGAFGRQLAAQALERGGGSLPPECLAAAAIPAGYVDVRSWVADGVRSTFAEAGVASEPDLRAATATLGGRAMVGPVAAVARAAKVRGMRVSQPELTSVALDALSGWAGRQWLDKDVVCDELAEAAARQGLEVDDAAARRCFDLLMKLPAFAIGDVVEARPWPVRAAWTRLFQRTITMVRLRAGFAPWPEDLVGFLCGEDIDEEVFDLAVDAVEAAESLAAEGGGVDEVTSLVDEDDEGDERVTAVAEVEPVG